MNHLKTYTIKDADRRVVGYARTVKAAKTYIRENGPGAALFCHNPEAWTYARTCQCDGREYDVHASYCYLSKEEPQR